MVLNSNFKRIRGMSEKILRNPIFWFNDTSLRSVREMHYSRKRIKANTGSILRAANKNVHFSLSFAVFGKLYSRLPGRNSEIRYPYELIARVGFKEEPSSFDFDRIIITIQSRNVSLRKTKQPKIITCNGIINNKNEMF